MKDSYGPSKMLMGSGTDMLKDELDMAYKLLENQIEPPHSYTTEMRGFVEWFTWSEGPEGLNAHTKPCELYAVVLSEAMSLPSHPSCAQDRCGQHMS